jgi:hypothetical protein
MPVNASVHQPILLHGGVSSISRKWEVRLQFFINAKEQEVRELKYRQII